MKHSREELNILVSKILGINVSHNIIIERADIIEWDSLKHFEIIFALEEYYGINFTAEQISGIASVNDIYEIIGDANEA